MDAVEHENRYVHAVYEAIGDHFSATRYRTWPRVQAFLEQLAHEALVLDSGAGNGKYALPVLRQHGYYIAADRCRRLLLRARWQSDALEAQETALLPVECVQADCLFLPFRSGVFDVALSIAVIHHVATARRRVGAVVELGRVLRPTGHALVYVWALRAIPLKLRSRAQSTMDGYLLPWHHKRSTGADALPQKISDSPSQTYFRFYHLFEEDELRMLVEEANAVSEEGAATRWTLRITGETFDHQNYVVEFQRQNIHALLEDAADNILHPSI
jgi:SAM-dependent methyltransferase